MAENSKVEVAPQGDGKPSQPKASVVSRLGRGLGSLIPAAPSAQTVRTNRGNESAESAAGNPGSARSGSEVIQTKVSGSSAGAGSSPVSSSAGRSSESSRGTATADTNLTQAGSGRSTGNIVGATEVVQEIQIALIARNTRQPRERFDDRAIAQLADSINLHGLLQPITIRKLAAPRGGKTYELIAGERRLRAFEVLKRSTVPALLRVADDSQSATLALIENIQREDLNPMERAKGLEKLIGEFGWTQQQAAERVGLDRATIANLLRLNDLDSFSSSCVRDGRLSQGHAKALLSIDNQQVRRALAERALHEEWSVRQLEREVQRAKSVSGNPSIPIVQSARKASVPITDLERRLGVFLGTKVSIRKGRKSGSGSMTIKFFSLDQFDGIINRLGFDPHSLSD